MMYATRYSTVSQVAVQVPAGRQTGEEIENEVRTRNPRISLPPGALRQMYGFEQRFVAAPGTYPSDLAAAAGQRALDQAGIGPDDIDLLIFASASEDLEEPATAHIVAHKLHITAPVFDVQNACNGVLNALEIADAFICTGRYGRVLIATGEYNTALSSLPVHDREQLTHLLPALTLGDLGAALLIEASDQPGIITTRFAANSAAWEAATVTNPYYGSDHGTLSVRFNSRALAAAFPGLEATAEDALHAAGHKSGDLDFVCVHQASVAFTRTILNALDVPEDKAVSVFPTYGNVATASLPLQLAEATAQGRLRPGNLVALFGLASGASGGMILLRWQPADARTCG
jgi:3-oxoacyl-[acyl-carrier-protein] synthase-3